MASAKKILTTKNMVVGIGILIFAIVMLIPIIITFNRFQEEKDFEKLVEMVNEATIKWAEINKPKTPLIISVNRLIKENYLIPDEDGEFLYNPRRSTKYLNCNTVYLEEINSSYQATFNDIEDCSVMEEEKLSMKLIATTSDGRILKSGEESRASIILYLDNDYEILSIGWYKNGEILIDYEFNESITLTDEIENGIYSVVVETLYGTKNFEFEVNIKKLAKTS